LFLIRGDEAFVVCCLLFVVCCLLFVGRFGSKGSISSMGSKGWGFSSADVGVITNHQSKFKHCLFRTKFLINGKCFQPLKPQKPSQSIA
jgi:hypothetical protein